MKAVLNTQFLDDEMSYFLVTDVDRTQYVFETLKFPIRFIFVVALDHLPKIFKQKIIEVKKDIANVIPITGKDPE
jgi:hypothetical protein